METLLWSPRVNSSAGHIFLESGGEKNNWQEELLPRTELSACHPILMLLPFAWSNCLPATSGLFGAIFPEHLVPDILPFRR
jgi:hypothetical protein